MKKHQKVVTDKAPKAIGPYSQAIIVASEEKIIYVSGQLPLDPETGIMVQGTIQELTKRVLDNIEAILHAAGSNMESILRMDIFLTDLKRDFAGMNEEYGKRFNDVPPARQTVQVNELPKGSIIEISCIAYQSTQSRN